jgi:hypothetical protein
MPRLGDADSQAEFEGHIESRCAGTISVQLHPRQVVNRVLRGCDQGANSLQPSPAKGNFERGARLKSERAKARDVGQQKIFEAVVVWDI